MDWKNIRLLIFVAPVMVIALAGGVGWFVIPFRWIGDHSGERFIEDVVGLFWMWVGLTAFFAILAAIGVCLTLWEEQGRKYDDAIMKPRWRRWGEATFAMLYGMGSITLLLLIVAFVLHFLGVGHSVWIVFTWIFNFSLAATAAVAAIWVCLLLWGKFWAWGAAAAVLAVVAVVAGIWALVQHDWSDDAYLTKRVDQMLADPDAPQFVATLTFITERCGKVLPALGQAAVDRYTAARPDEVRSARADLELMLKQQDPKMPPAGTTTLCERAEQWLADQRGN
jgi:hypothetical protein